MALFLAAGDFAETLRTLLTGRSDSYHVLDPEASTSEANEDLATRLIKRDKKMSKDADSVKKTEEELAEEDAWDKLILVRRDSPDICLFRNVPALKEQTVSKAGHNPLQIQGVPLVLENHPDMGVVRMRPEPIDVGPFGKLIRLGFGRSADAIHIALDQDGFITEVEGYVFDVDRWEFGEGNHIQLIRGPDEGMTRLDDGEKSGRCFVLNDDGSISPKSVPEMALGYPCEIKIQNLQDRETLTSLVRYLQMLGYINFITMPLTFMLAFLGYSKFVYPLIAFKAVSVGTLQGRMLRALSKWQTSKTDEQMESIRDAWMHINEMSKSPLHILASLVDLIEVVDTDLDAMTAGNSFHAMSAAQQIIFARSWESVPLMNVVADKIGLPGMLTTLVLLYSLSQLKMFRQYIHQLSAKSKYWPLNGCSGGGGESRFWFNHHIYMAADLGGLMATVDVTGTLWKYITTPEKEEREMKRWNSTADRGEGFVWKVFCEILPSAWLTISMLGLIFDTAPRLVLVQTVMSVASSLFTSLKIEYNIVSHFWRQMLSWEQLRNVYHIRQKFFLTVILLVGITIMSFRLAGVWECPDHIWNLTSLGCANVD